jgi:hypothetical protein
VTSRRAAFLFLRVAVSAGLVGWLLSRVDLATIPRAISNVGAGELLLIFALQLVNTALKSWKWQKLLEADGIRVSHLSAFGSYMVGTFFNVFLPSSVGGDAVRAVDAGRRSGRGLAALTSVAADRVLGFVAIGVMGLAAIACGAASGLDARAELGGAALYLAVLAASAVVFARRPLEFARALRLPRMPRVERAVVEAASSLLAYRRSRKLALLTALSIAAQAIVVVVVWLLARSLEIAAPLSYFFAIVPLVALVESIPVSVYGIGLRDASYVSLLGLVGTEQARALSLSFLYVAVSVAYALAGGVVFALRPSPENGDIPDFRAPA